MGHKDNTAARPKPVTATKFSPIDRAFIRALSGCAEDTIKAYPNVRDASRRRIEAAAASAGIALPMVDQTPPRDAA